MLRCCGLTITKDNYNQHCNHHKGINNGRIPYPVSTCKKNYATKYNLERHFGSSHPKLCSILVGLPIPPDATYEQISVHLINNKIPFSKNVFRSNQFKQHPIEDEKSNLSRAESERLTNQYIENLEDGYDNVQNFSNNTFNAADFSVEVDLEDLFNAGKLVLLD